MHKHQETQYDTADWTITTFILVPPQSPTVTEYEGTVFESYAEWIDTTTRKRAGIFPQNPCDHERHDVWFNHGSYTWWNNTHTWECVADDAANFFSMAHLTGLTIPISGWPPQLYFDWAGASARAYQAMKPDVSAGSQLNLTMFLVEIRDLKRLADLWQSRHGIIQNLAGGYLNYQFGYKQAFKDLRDIINRAYDWQSRLRDYLRRANSNQVRHYSETPDLPSSFLGETLFNTGQPSPDHRRTINVPDYKYSATMGYSYRVPEYRFGVSERKVRAFLDAWGLNVNPSTLWDLIPFSFVVDWFTGVGSWLKSQEDNFLEPAMCIQSFSHSLKYSFTEVVEVRRAYGPWIVVKTGDGKKYHRRVGVPEMGPVPFDGGEFTPRRVALATSLFVTRFR